MTVGGPSARWLLVDGWDLGASAFMGAFQPSAQGQELEDMESPFKTAPALLPVGYTTGTDISAAFWADSTLQALIDELHGTTVTTRATARVICYGWTAAAALPTAFVPVKFEGCTSYQTTVEPKMPGAKMTQFAITVKPNGRVNVGDILKPLGSTTIDGVGVGDTKAAYVDGGAAAAPSTNGGVGYFQYTALALAGSTNFLPEVVDSTDHAAWTTLIAFTAVTGTRGAERKTVAGDVKRYIASAWAYTGFAGAPTCTSFVGFARL